MLLSVTALLHGSPSMSERDQYLAQVDRLCGSDVLHGSESLCRLLRYLAKKELENAGVHVKEYQIATEVFGRPSDFDRQVDSTIRVQAARLRAKLGDYYSSAGLNDPVVVELPRGSYSLQFRHRAPANGKPERETANQSPERPVAPPAPHRTWLPALTLLLALIVVLAVALTVVVFDKNPAQGLLASESDPAVQAFRVFWQPFLKGPQDPWVIFSNGAFVGRPETGMRYFDPKRDAKSQIWDHYTGVGEVLAIHELDQVFGELRQRIRVKRGSLFSLDDANNNNLIFVGSPSENLTLSNLPSMRDFVFQRVSEGPRKGDLAIVNVHPRPD